jgi:hypothetical protein
MAPTLLGTCFKNYVVTCWTLAMCTKSALHQEVLSILIVASFWPANFAKCKVMTLRTLQCELHLSCVAPSQIAKAEVLRREFA